VILRLTRGYAVMSYTCGHVVHISLAERGPWLVGVGTVVNSSSQHRLGVELFMGELFMFALPSHDLRLSTAPLAHRAL